VLVEESGVEPGQELRRLEAAVLAVGRTWQRISRGHQSVGRGR
jgi:hypothetical protein